MATMMYTIAGLAKLLGFSGGGTGESIVELDARSEKKNTLLHLDV